MADRIFTGTLKVDGELTAPGAGANSEVIGAGASAAGARAVAVGYLAQATAQEAVAIGDAASAGATQAIAIGDAASVGAAAAYGIAIGSGASSTGQESVSVGFNATSSAFGIAMGRRAKSTEGVSVGYYTFSSAKGTAVGGTTTGPLYTTSGLGANNTVVGNTARINQTSTITVVDYTLIAAGTDTLSLTRPTISTDPLVGTEGTEWTAATSNNATASSIASWLEGLGNQRNIQATANANVVTVVGDLSALTTTAAGGAMTVALGTSHAGSVAVGKDASASNSNSVALGFNASVTGVHTICVGKDASDNNANRSVVIGALADINSTPGTNTDAVVIGYNATAGATTSASLISIGYNASATGNTSTVIGSSSTDGGFVAGTIVGAAASITGNFATTLGQSTTAASNGVAIGSDASAAHGGATIVGASADSGGTNAVALGFSAHAEAQGVAIGSSANCAHPSSIALGGFATTTASNQLVIGDETANNYAITSIHVGEGVTALTPPATITWSVTYTTTTETDVAGSSIVWRSGAGTGNSTGSNFTIQTPVATTTGTTQQLQVNRLIVSDGAVTVPWNATNTTDLSCPGAGTSSERFGLGASATGNNSLAIGANTIVAHDSAIGLGQGATTSAANQLVIGSDSSPITTAYIGEGVTSATPQDLSINATGGSGTDINAGDLYIAGGKGTGSGDPGNVFVQVSETTGSGTTLQTLENRIEVSPEAVNVVNAPLKINSANISKQLRYGSIYWSTPASTTLGAATPAKAAGTTTTNKLIGFTHPANNRLTYTGTDTVHFEVIASLSLTKQAGSGTLCSAFIAKSGTNIANSRRRRQVPATDEGVITTSWSLDLATNDYVELWVSSANGDDITVQTCFFSVKEVTI